MFRSLDGYRWGWLPRDLTAGLLIVALAIPLSMGMAEVAGMPPIAGLYSCVLPLVAYALFGSSPQLVVALDASTAALVATAVAPLAAGDPIRYGALAGLVAILVGVMLIAAACMRLGVVTKLLTPPVLLGYQAGLAVVVVLSQLPRLLGLQVEHSETLPRAFEITTRVDAWSVPTTLLGGAALAVYLGGLSAGEGRRDSVDETPKEYVNGSHREARPEAMASPVPEARPASTWAVRAANRRN